MSGKVYAEGVPCDHPGCFSHMSHPCEGCGRTAGMKVTTIAAKDVTKNLELTVVVTGMKVLKIRMFIGLAFIHLAAWIIGCGINIGTVKNEEAV